MLQETKKLSYNEALKNLEILHVIANIQTCISLLKTLMKLIKRSKLLVVLKEYYYCKSQL